MKRHQIEQLIYRILATEDEEINCEQLFDLIARYVDLEISGTDAARLLPMVKQHLIQCDGCSELYQTLHELAMLEAQDALPAPEELLDEILSGAPPPDLAPQPVFAAPPSGTLDAAGPAPGRGQPAPAPAARPENFWRRLAQSLGGLRWSWVATAAVVVLVLGLSLLAWQLSGQIAEMKAALEFIAESDRVVALQGTELDPDAKGFLFIDDQQQKSLLLIYGLDPLPKERVYQMWVKSNGDDLMSAAIFRVEKPTDGWQWLELQNMPQQFTNLLITAEPEGGNTAPSSQPVCVKGKLAS